MPDGTCENQQLAFRATKVRSNRFAKRCSFSATAEKNKPLTKCVQLNRTIWRSLTTDFGLADLAGIGLYECSPDASAANQFTGRCLYL